MQSLVWFIGGCETGRTYERGLSRGIYIYIYMNVTSAWFYMRSCFVYVAFVMSAKAGDYSDTFKPEISFCFSFFYSV